MIQLPLFAVLKQYKPSIPMRTKKIARKLCGLLMAGAVVMCMSYTTTGKNHVIGEWSAPASADATVNPLKGDIASVAAGKKIYTQLCVVCHGDKGKGDGIAGASLNPHPADHSLPKFQKQSDGAIFWKISTGRPPMASYEKILTPTQRWQVVNYLRTLSAAPKHS